MHCARLCLALALFSSLAGCVSGRSAILSQLDTPPAAGAVAGGPGAVSGAAALRQSNERAPAWARLEDPPKPDDSWFLQVVYPQMQVGRTFSWNDPGGSGVRYDVAITDVKPRGPLSCYQSTGTWTWPDGERQSEALPTNCVGTREEWQRQTAAENAAVADAALKAIGPGLLLLTLMMASEPAAPQGSDPSRDMLEWAACKQWGQC